MRHLHQYSRIALAALTVVIASSCSIFRRTPPLPVTEEKTKALWVWNEVAAAKAKGPRSIQVHLDEQKAKVYQGTTLIGWSYIASGISKYPTPKGSFKVLEKTANKLSNLYGKMYDASGKCVNDDAKMGRDPLPEGGKFVGARMAYWMRVTNDGIGLHVGPIPHPGHRASHGCIRMPRDAAEKFFANISIGTPVIIIDKEGDIPPRYVPPPVKKTATVMKPQVRAPSDTTIPGLPLPSSSQPVTPAEAPVPQPAPAPTPTPAPAGQ